jgi:hypothetical protein
MPRPLTAYLNSLSSACTLFIAVHVQACYLSTSDPPARYSLLIMYMQAHRPLRAQRPEASAQGPPCGGCPACECPPAPVAAPGWGGDTEGKEPTGGWVSACV